MSRVLIFETTPESAIERPLYIITKEDANRLIAERVELNKTIDYLISIAIDARDEEIEHNAQLWRKGVIQTESEYNALHKSICAKWNTLILIEKVPMIKAVAL